MISETRALPVQIPNAERLLADLGWEHLARLGSLTHCELANVKSVCIVEWTIRAQDAESKSATERGPRSRKKSLAGVSYCSGHETIEYKPPRVKEKDKKEIFRCALHVTENKNFREQGIPVGSLSASNVHARDTFKSTSQNPLLRPSSATIIWAEISSRARRRSCSPNDEFKPEKILAFMSSVTA